MKKAKKLDQRQLSANLGSTIRGRVAGKAGYFGALELAGSVAKYALLGPAELEKATRQFDEEMVVKRSRPLNARERRLWEKARRRPGRPKKACMPWRRRTAED